MNGTRRWRWERLLLLLATILGVVAMHATVGPGHEAAAPVAGVAGVSAAAGAATGHDPMTSLPADAPATSVPAPGTMPMPMAHELMHLCLAIMALGLAVGLLIVACAIRVSGRSPRRAAARVRTRPSRPPRPHAVRLAQLCVLRN